MIDPIKIVADAFSPPPRYPGDLPAVREGEVSSSFEKASTASFGESVERFRKAMFEMEDAVLTKATLSAARSLNLDADSDKGSVSSAAKERLERYDSV